jgi:hypothetical protein
MQPNKMFCFFLLSFHNLQMHITSIKGSAASSNNNSSRSKLQPRGHSRQFLGQFPLLCLAEAVYEEDVFLEG